MWLFAFASARAGAESESDRELAARLNRGDAEALRALYDRHSRIVFSFLLRMMRDRAAAEELLQETFLRLWRNPAAYEPDRGPLTPWLLTVARNLALDRLRSSAERQRRREETGAERPPERAVAAAAEDWVDARRLEERVRRALAALTDEQRQAIELAYYRGMSHSEVAGAMERPLGTVKTWVRTALLRLRDELGGAP